MTEPVDLNKTEWKSDRKGKYPRKIWFGLTDYGPVDHTILERVIYALGVGLAVLMFQGYHWLF